MPLLTRFRLRWARWFSFFTALCAVAYWAERHYHRQTVAKIVEADTNLPLELEPTLAHAQDVTATALPVTSKPKSSWNLQPQWRTELSGSMGEHSRQVAKDSTPQLPIPESFPLPPRFKKGPPAVGNAIVEYRESMKPALKPEPIRQPQSSSLASRVAPETIPSSPSFSPFGSSSLQNVAQSTTTFSSSRSVSATTRFESEPAWPDTTFAASSPVPTQAVSPLDVTTPNLLTNARLQPSCSISPTSSLPNQAPSFRPHVAPPSKAQPDPNSSNYIRQPMR